MVEKEMPVFRKPLCSAISGCHYQEIARVMNTQKCVATTMRNKQDELLCIRTCSEPTGKALKSIK